MVAALVVLWLVSGGAGVVLVSVVGLGTMDEAVVVLGDEAVVMLGIIELGII